MKTGYVDLSTLQETQKELKSKEIYPDRQTRQTGKHTECSYEVLCGACEKNMERYTLPKDPEGREITCRLCGARLILECINPHNP